MEPNLQTALELIEAGVHLSEENKAAIIARLNAADKKMGVDAFRIERGEHLKRTMSVLLEETIEELEQKRKAVEEKNRQLEIEASLERVRAAAMGMAKPDDLLNICKLTYLELQALGFTAIRNSQIFIFDDPRGAFINYGFSDQEGANIAEIFYDSHPKVEAFITTVRKTSDAFAELSISGDELTAWRQYRIDNGEPDDLRLGNIDTLYYYFYSIGIGAIGISNFEALSLAQRLILKRFRNVFDLAYRRYADIQLAEAQAKEARLETALERIRAVAMAMKKADELIGVCQVAYTELKALGFSNIRNAQIAIPKDDKGFYYAFEYSDHSTIKMREAHNSTNSLLKEFLESMEKSKDAFFQKQISGKEFDDWRAWRRGISADDDPRVAGADSLCFYFFSIGAGSLGISSYDPISNDQLQTLKRFKKVFELSYTRFTDVAKAEAQARESQIQLALERVRARTMAMQRSDELAETSVEVFKQLIGLGIQPNRLFIGIIKDNSGDIELWATDEDGSKISTKFTGNKSGNRSVKAMYEGWKSHQKSVTIDMKGEELKDYFRYLVEELKVPFKLGLSSKRRVQSIAYFSQGFIGMAAPESQPEETIDLMERFAGVFNLTYTRFNDLKLAEEQAREAKIEGSLERVRGKAMAMRNSNDLSVTASMVFTELRKLGINPIRCGVGMVNNKSRKVALYSATTSAEGDSLGLLGWVMLESHPVLDKIYESLLNNEDYFPVLKGKQLEAYYENLLSGLSLPTLPDFHPGEVQYGHFFPFADGCLYAWADKRYDDAEIRILKRFASVIDLTFRRYFELQKSEAGARDAVRAASLDRVRADIASMRKQSDLERITPLIWDELTILGIPFIRCGVFIMDEEQKLIHTFLSTPDGKAIGAFHIPFDTSGNFEKMVSNWRNREPYIDHWKEEAFSQFADTLVKQGAISSKTQYMRTLPRAGVHLNFLPFLQGMLYVGNSEPLAEDNISLIQAVAEAFSTAYARYEDFNKLEAAKQQVDTALTDLKATQTQLIQSEKMASLGELTAGIAHEIQNPLNFVNNFSDVNREMIDELKEELKAGNLEDVLAIANDIQQNEEKINHHGKRADFIVKGMLQHSRTSTSEKQETNINTLADEFLKLSYHGLRAKDKSFNADITTNFDEKLPKINVIAQDIGRVLLNLFNNAFYAVNQKQKTAGSDYKPDVSVSSSVDNNQVIIKVKDNGIGIPDSIKEKVMQPFFTTKPTGEGTGLGLSLTYDMVVKGHGGNITVDTKEGEFTEFTISLPL